jgi:hypothetical protein
MNPGVGVAKRLPGTAAKSGPSQAVTKESRIVQTIKATKPPRSIRGQLILVMGGLAGTVEQKYAPGQRVITAVAVEKLLLIEGKRPILTV